MDSSFADLILPFPMEGYFTYSIPEALKGKVLPGCRVVVRFGIKKFFSAVVHEVHDRKPDNYQVKEIEYLLDSVPVVPPESFLFWDWVSNYYHASAGEVLKTALPSGLKLESETRIIYNPDYSETKDSRLTPKEQLLLEIISRKKNLSVTELNDSALKKSSISILKDLLLKNAVRIEEDMKESYRPRTVSVITLSPKLSAEKDLHFILDSLKKIPRQRELLNNFIFESGIFNKQKQKEIRKKEFLQANGNSITVLNALIKKDIFRIIEKPADPILPPSGQIQSVSQLSPAQEIALTRIKDHFRNKPATLLYGVTSSGKTEIYIKLILEQLEKGKQVLYLLPEIGLTTQIIFRLRKVFGHKTGICHSRLNDRERVEIWNKVLNFKPDDGESQDSCPLIIGARSALFLPFRNLGLIIVDEEHDTSYKQFDPAPRYNARDAAVVLGNLQKIPVLLGSATPSIESFYNCNSGKYGLVLLQERYAGAGMPVIQTANLKDAYNRRQMRSQLTPLLFEEMNKALERKEQIILFQNRRGFSPFIQCKSCGSVPKCHNCDVSLTFHKHSNSLICHYCGFTVYKLDKCPDCKSADLTSKGFGTEKVEEDIKALFPQACIERIDFDTTRSKKAFERLTGAFESGSVDILIGTQMITKGLDFSNVSLVGILNADNLLNHPDFRSYERSFQLMAQVAGRAGRKNKPGKVIIQTFDPDNPLIRKVINNDYEGMYEEQLAERKQFKYPPFYRLITIILKHREKKEADRIADMLAEELHSRFGRRVMGPEYPLISRIKALYIKQIWIKIERETSVVNAKRQMKEIITEVKSRPGNKTAIISVDIDPM